MWQIKREQKPVIKKENVIEAVEAEVNDVDPNAIQDFSVDDDECANQAYKLALPFLLNNRKNKAIIELISNSFSIEKIAQELFANTIIYHSNIAYPINFSSLLGKQIQITKDEWTKITQEIDSSIQQIIYKTENFEGKPINFIQALTEVFQNNIFDKAPEFDSLLEFFKSQDEIAPINLELKNYLDKIILVLKIKLFIICPPCGRWSGTSPASVS